jgi:5-methylcytosine-specific restriction endonuclease McrA
MIRRRPIPRTRLKPAQSLRYESIYEGAAIRFPNGREVCQENALGRRLYANRVQAMVQRQNFRCSLCGRRLSLGQATFDHEPRRKMGSAFRDDRISDGAGNWLSSAAHWTCNDRKG